MAKRRRTYTASFKAKVALAAARGDKTLSELASKFGLHANQISKWKSQLLEGAEELFRDGRHRERDESEASESELYEQIGRLKVEVEWLKKKVDGNVG
jgi:putative transposase